MTRRPARGSALVPIARALSHDLDRMSFAAPVAHVYNPLEYAWAPHEAYLERYGAGEREVLLLGMNPGPFGMAQCGIPFGDVAMARDFLGIEAKVGRPRREHPKRPV
ncbi:MAG: single-stranded DNA-binding protein, partial [Deltaproteobacteria bacterium]|nr:single-stranded DNA-binding protein [Deltaproteobacteria bacterium]